MKSSLIALLRNGGVAGHVISRTPTTVQVLTPNDEVMSYAIRDVALTLSGSLRHHVATQPDELKLEFQSDPEGFFLRHLRSATIDGTKRITLGAQVVKEVCSIVSPLIPAKDIEVQWKMVSERWKRSTGNRDVNLFQDGPGKPFKFQARWIFEPEFAPAPVDQLAIVKQEDAPTPKPASLAQLEREFLANPSTFVDELKLNWSEDSLPSGSQALDPFVRFLELGLNSTVEVSGNQIKAKTFGYLESLVKSLEGSLDGAKKKTAEAFLRAFLLNLLRLEIWPKNLSPEVEAQCLSLIPFSSQTHSRLLSILKSTNVPKGFFGLEDLDRLIARTPWSNGLRRELISQAQHHNDLLQKDLLWSGASLMSLVDKTGPDISHLLIGGCSNRLEAALHLTIASSFDIEICAQLLASPNWLRIAIDNFGLTKKLQGWVHSGTDPWLNELLTDPEFVSSHENLKKLKESASSAEQKSKQMADELAKELARHQNLVTVLKNKVEAYEQTRSDQLHDLASAAARDVLKSFALAINEMNLHAIDLSPEQVINRLKHYGLEIGLAENEQVGELVAFESNRHDAGDETPTHGEMVVVTRSGFSWLYKGQQTVVLKAKVALV